MTGTKKTLLFFSSFFLTILFMSIVSYTLYPFINNISNYILSNVLIPILYTIYFIVFLFIQGIIRYLMTKKYFKNNAILIKSKTEDFILKEKLLIYLIIFLIYFMPLITKLSLEPLNLPRIILFIISILVIEILIRISNKSIYGYFTRDYIIISGLDLRISLPIVYGSHIHNDSTIYSYNDIENYFIFKDVIELYLIGDQGKLVLNIDTESSRQFVGLLKQKKIPMKKFR